jgi:hypothetical protein
MGEVGCSHTLKIALDKPLRLVYNSHIPTPARLDRDAPQTEAMRDEDEADGFGRGRDGHFLGGASR